MRKYRKEFIEKLESGGRIYEEELLNMLLSNAYGGKDFSALSKALLARFPGVRAIIGASYGEIMSVEGMTESIATYFKTLELIINAENRRVLYIKNAEQAFEVAEERFKFKDSECIEMYFLNTRGLVIDIKTFTSKKADRVDVDLGSLLSAITVSKAHAMYFAHNHINCPADPSPKDDNATAKLLQACDLSGVKFLDHIIVSSTGDRFSYLMSGKLSELKRLLKLD